MPFSVTSFICLITLLTDSVSIPKPLSPANASPLNLRMFVTWLIYIGGFYVFYLSNSIRVNLGIAREGYNEWQTILIGALANCLGLVFMIIINYYVYFTTGTVFFGYYSATDTNEMWLYINMGRI